MSGSCFLTLRDNAVQNPRCSPAWPRLLHFFYANASLRTNPLRCLSELCLNNRCILSVRFDSSSRTLHAWKSWLYTVERFSQNGNDEGKTWRTGHKTDESPASFGFSWIVLVRTFVNALKRGTCSCTNRPLWKMRLVIPLPLYLHPVPFKQVLKQCETFSFNIHR